MIENTMKLCQSKMNNYEYRETIIEDFMLMTCEFSV